MRVLLIALMALAATACAKSPEMEKREAEINDRGFAQVGKTPNGKPLYVKYISQGDGYAADRVYFTDGVITAVQDCGKNCERSVVTVENASKY